MLNRKNQLKAALVLLGATTMLANCAPKNGAVTSTDSSSQSSQSTGSGTTATMPQTQNMKVSVTSVSNPNLQNLFLNISRVDMLLSKDGQTALVNVAKNLGVVDLQSLKNGLTSQLAGITLPQGFNLQQINLVLGQTGNTAVAQNGSQCQLQIPGGLGNILPLTLGQGLNISNNSFFNLLMGIDTSSAVTSLGNGTCAFNPILGLASAYKFDLGSVLGAVTNGSLNLSNPKDILASLFPQLAQAQQGSASGGSGLGGLIGSIIGGLTGGSQSGSSGTSTAGSLISGILSGLLSNGGISNSLGSLTNGQVSLPIDLSSGNFATGSGVASLISALLQQQVQNNTTSTTSNTLGSLNNPLQLLQLLAMFVH